MMDEKDIGKHRALSREVTCYFRLYFEIGWTSVLNQLKKLKNLK